MTNETPIPPATPRDRRIIHLIFAGILGAAVVGFFIGIGRAPTPVERSAFVSPQPVDANIMPATAYRDLNMLEAGPNRDFETHIRSLVQPDIDVPVVDPVAKLASLEMRAARRAYNGAPPVVPHPIDQLSSDACLACHESGLRFAGQSASRMPHPYMTNCTQCHVEQQLPTFDPTLVVASAFAGKPAPFEGPRAYPGAPPIIPHTTHMRDDCLACHGPTAMPGLRTTHPERQSCTQCHAPSAMLDQWTNRDAPTFLPPPDTPRQTP